MLNCAWRARGYLTLKAHPMSVHYIPFLMDERALTDEILRLRRTLPLEKIDEAIQKASDERDLKNDRAMDNPPVVTDTDPIPETLPEERPECADLFRKFSNSRLWFQETDPLRFQLLVACRDSTREYHTNEAEQSADALYQFLGAFHFNDCTNNAINDYGLTESCALSPFNSRRLHNLFLRIDFEALAPAFADYLKTCREPVRLDSIEILKEYVSTFDALVKEAVSKNKVLYIRLL